MAVIPASSTEYLHVPVTASPAGSEWRTASWDDGSARLLIGPGTDTVLTAGDYRVWISIDPPGAENVIRQSGVLSVT